MIYIDPNPHYRVVGLGGVSNVGSNARQKSVHRKTRGEKNAFLDTGHCAAGMEQNAVRDAVSYHGLNVMS